MDSVPYHQKQCNPGDGDISGDSIEYDRSIGQPHDAGAQQDKQRGHREHMQQSTPRLDHVGTSMMKGGVSDYMKFLAVECRQGRDIDTGGKA